MEVGWCPVLLHSSVSFCGAASSALQPKKDCDEGKYVNKEKLFNVFTVCWSVSVCSFLKSIPPIIFYDHLNL